MVRSRFLLAVGVGLLACGDGTGPDSGPVRVQLFYVGGRGPASIRVTVREDSITQSVMVGSSNAVALGDTASDADSVEIRVEDVGGATPRFHSSLVVVSRADLLRTQKFVLIPRRWTITAATKPCRYAAQNVGIDLDLAYARSVADASSFYWRIPDAGGGWTYRTAAFPRSAMPIPVAFDRARSTDPISQSDSVAFWNTVTELESELCDNVFRAAGTNAVTGSQGVAVMVDRELDAPARGGPVSATSRGEQVLVGGSVVCRTTACLASSETVRHELMHVLGFGHSCSWPTIMRAGCSGAPRASPEDVAYFQVYYAARALQLENGAQHSLAAAHRGEVEAPQ